MFFSADDPSPVEPDQAHADVDHPRADAALSSAQRHGIAPLQSLRDPARCCCLMRDCVDQLPPHRIELSGSVVVIPDVSSWRTIRIGLSQLFIALLNGSGANFPSFAARIVEWQRV